MSTLHKVKAYFGMAPMDDYEDDYYEDDERGAPRAATVAPARTDSRTMATLAGTTTCPRPAAATTTSPPRYRGGFDDGRFEGQDAHAA